MSHVKRTTSERAASKRVVFNRVGVTALALSLILSACSESTGPSPFANETAQLEFVAAQVTAEMQAQDRAGRRIPLLTPLLRQVIQEIQAGGHPEAEALLEEARQLAMQAREAFQAGDREAAMALLKQSHQKLLEAIALVLGSEGVANAVDAVANLVARVEERLSDRDLPDRVIEVLANANAAVTEAQTALGGGDLVVALSSSLKAAHLIHALTDHIQMRRQAAQNPVFNAERLLRIAEHAAGDEPSDAVAEAIAQASALLDQAKTALQAGDTESANTLANQSAEISREVIRMLRGDRP